MIEDFHNNDDIKEDNIVAAASNISQAAAIVIIRLSGPDTHTLLKKCLPKGVKAEHAYLRLTKFYDVESKELIDEPMVVFFNGPHSYTGENSAEIHVHGGPYIVRRALKNLQKAGFRLAEPGEFTRRAYLNNKLDLVASEGIHTLITASSEQEWLSAKYLLEGKLQKEVKTLHQRLVEVMAFLEAKIDFPEEEDPSGYERTEVKRRAEIVQGHIKKLIDSYENGKITSEGLKIALIGPPNAGKSTLMNYFLQKDRAIVTDTPGTTRDYLEEKALFKGRLISIIDTAGLRETADAIEHQGVVQAKKIAKEVDLVLFLFPNDQDQESFDTFRKSIEPLKSLSHINLLTKIDITEEQNFVCEEKLLPISCHSGKNLDQLVDKIVDKVDYHTNEFRNNVSITSSRHLSLLETAHDRLEKFIAAMDEPNYDEILAFELREINETLAKIIGQIHTDDILEEIFSRFCIGK